MANLTRKDGNDFIAAALVHTPHTSIEAFALEDANLAIEQLRKGSIKGAAVLVMDPHEPGA